MQALNHVPSLVIRASKKQTPESVWYKGLRSPKGLRYSCLKEADARKRLVLVSHLVGGYESRVCLKEADARKRLVFRMVNTVL